MVLTEAEAEERLAELRRRREAIDRAITDLTLYLELGRRLGGASGGTAPAGPDAAGLGQEAGPATGQGARQWTPQGARQATGHGTGQDAGRAGGPTGAAAPPLPAGGTGQPAAAGPAEPASASGAIGAVPETFAAAPVATSPDVSAQAPRTVPPLGSALSPAPAGEAGAQAGQGGGAPAGGSTQPADGSTGPAGDLIGPDGGSTEPAGGLAQAPPAASGLRVPMAEAVRVGADAPGLSEGVLARRYGRALVEAAVAVLEQAGRPLHASEIFAALSERGFAVPGSDPVAALNTRLWKRSGPGGPLRRLGDAVYALGEGDKGLWRFGRL